MHDPIHLADFLPYQLSVASNAVSQLIAREYEARFGLNIPEWRLIAVLGQNIKSNGQPQTQTSLVDSTRMDKVTVSRATKALVDRGLLLREPSLTDGRSHHLRLSDVGIALYQDIVPAARRIEQSILAEFPAQQQKLLGTLLADITATADRLRDRL
jgi:DNA-binding MarR family transcriptional regulator